MSWARIGDEIRKKEGWTSRSQVSSYLDFWSSCHDERLLMERFLRDGAIQIGKRRISTYVFDPGKPGQHTDAHLPHRAQEGSRNQKARTSKTTEWKQNK